MSSKPNFGRTVSIGEIHKSALTCSKLGKHNQEYDFQREFATRSNRVHRRKVVTAKLRKIMTKSLQRRIRFFKHAVY